MFLAENMCMFEGRAKNISEISFPVKFDVTIMDVRLFIAPSLVRRIAASSVGKPDTPFVTSYYRHCHDIGKSSFDELMKVSFPRKS